jgi:hypothetical protein
MLYQAHKPYHLTLLLVRSYKIMYKLLVKPSWQPTDKFVEKLVDNKIIPFAQDNTDYQQFKKDLAEGASLKDAEGNDMTAEQITTFLGTLA